MAKNGKKTKLFKRIAIASSVCVVLVFSLMFVVVQANSAGQHLQDTDSFGIGNQRFSTDAQVGVIANNEYDNGKGFESSSTGLATYSTRDISTALASISFKIELAAKAAAEAARAQELIEINMAKNRRNEHARTFGMPEGLSEVNWDQGKDAFIDEWTQRLNNYFIGSPLANSGVIFASAAWENKIDPRWSAAISNTESSKGYHCFASYNAWGWGNSGWGSWDEAINAHVNGLATKYGYTITRPYAEKYCPPNCDNWYNNTLNQMLLI